MRYVPVELKLLVASMPPLPRAELDACADKVGRYLAGVVNAEGPGGIGERMTQRFPIHSLAVTMLGHAIAQQSYPDALMPADEDDSRRADVARADYAHVGCWMLSGAPDINQRGGVFAAAGVACTLAAQVKLDQQAALSLDALEADTGRIGPEATTAALTFIDDAIKLQALLDGCDAAASHVQRDEQDLEITRL